MQKGRTRTDILCKVLDSIEHGTQNPIHILFNTKLSKIKLTETIEILQNKNYILEHHKEQTKFRVKYSLTQEGKDALTKINHIKNLISKKGLLVNLC